MAKKQQNKNTFDESMDFDLIVNDPLDEVISTAPSPQKSTDQSETNIEKTEQKKQSPKLSSSEIFGFTDLVNIINSLDDSLKDVKFTTVQVPENYLALIRDIARYNGKNISLVVAAILKKSFMDMSDDIKKMIKEQEKNKKNLFE